MGNNAQADSLPNEDVTETYLLTNKGLEKLDIEKEIGIKPGIKPNLDKKSDNDKKESRKDLNNQSRYVKIPKYHNKL